jgi:hypothetical protein
VDLFFARTTSANGDFTEVHSRHTKLQLLIKATFIMNIIHGDDVLSGMSKGFSWRVQKLTFKCGNSSAHISPGLDRPNEGHLSFNRRR